MKNSGIVYSTEEGKMCPSCNNSLTACVCQKAKASPKSDGKVRVGRSTKGRKGKGVTVITDLPLAHEALFPLSVRPFAGFGVLRCAVCSVRRVLGSGHGSGTLPPCVRSRAVSGLFWGIIRLPPHQEWPV